MTFPSPVAPLTRKQNIWSSTSPVWLIKYVPVINEKDADHCSSEIAAAIAGSNRFAPNYLGMKFVSDHPSDQNGLWLAIWIERFPFTLKDWPERLNKKETKQMLDIISIMHSFGVFHCDLHPGNVVLRRSSDGALEIKLIDFGLSRFSSSEHDRNYWGFLDIDILRNNSMKKHLSF